jgi:D-hydroxyproline dehydrogenase subunit beta
MPAPDVLVVGAGIVGAACADALTEAGLSVEILESRFAGAGATAAAMGHLVVMDDSEAQFALTSLSRRLWVDRASEIPRDCEDVETGTLWIAADEEEQSHVRKKAAFYRQRGISVEELSGEDLEREEPNLRPGLAGALLVPGDRVLYPVNAARWLLSRAGARGAVRREGVEATAIFGRRVETRQGTVEAGAVVNACGAAAPLLTPGLPIAPRKGHLVITDRYPGFCRRQLVELGYLKSAHTPSPESVAFNLQPRATGQMLLGSSREFVGLDPSINRRVRARMLSRAFEYSPALANLSAIRTWVGFRPSTPDNLPLIGAWGESPGLFVAAGHEGLGITTATGTGRLIADAILRRPSPIDARPYSPAREFETAHA